MKQIKQAIALLTLCAFICGLQGCTTIPQQGVTYNKRANSYYNSNMLPGIYTAKHYSAETEENHISTYHVLGLGTGVAVGIAALAGLFILTLPFVFTGHIPVG
jgi:hypothetical protein